MPRDLILTMSESVVRTGVSVVIVDSEGNVLMGVRKGSHGAGTLAFPGGHLEFGESWWECAEREVKEETDLDLEGLTFLGATNDLFEATDTAPRKHYTTIFVRATVKADSAPFRLVEPDKCEGWGWVSRQDLETTTNLFVPVANFLAAGYRW